MSILHEKITVIPLVKYPQAIPLLAKWFYEEWHSLYPERSLEVIAKDLADQKDDDSLPQTLIALNPDNEVIGTVTLEADDMDTRPELSPWIANVYVSSAHRGSGIGRFLMDKITEKAAFLGYKHLYLYTPDQERWYANQGWMKMETMPYRGKQVTLMQKRL